MWFPRTMYACWLHFCHVPLGLVAGPCRSVFRWQRTLAASLSCCSEVYFAVYSLPPSSLIYLSDRPTDRQTAPPTPPPTPHPPQPQHTHHWYGLLTNNYCGFVVFKCNKNELPITSDNGGHDKINSKFKPTLDFRTEGK